MLVRRLGTVGTVTASLLLLAACTGGAGGSAPGGETSAPAAGAAVIAKFAAAWPSASTAKFRGILDDPVAAARDIGGYDTRLGITSTRVALDGQPACNETQCNQEAKVTASLAGTGQWRYTTQIASRLHQGRWLVAWTPGTFYPALTAATTLVLNRALPPRAPLLDRNGVALTPERAILRIGVVPRRVRTVTYSRLADLLSVDSGSLRERVAAAQPDWFVSVIDLRRKDYLPLRTQLLRVPGIVVDPARRPLAPTAAWGRAVLGTVGPATSDTLKNAGPFALPTDEIGTSGLQLAYQQRLAGVPGVSIDLVKKSTPGRVVNTIFKRPPSPGRPLRTSLDRAAQAAAEKAVVGATSTTALVAIKASTGDILAAANAPGPTSYNTAFVGRYAPGSTFKVVSATALLENSLAAARTPIDCPDSITVGGKAFTNYAPGILPGPATFADAFAASCNTAFVSFADKLSGAELARTAKRFGLGAAWDIGLDAFSGSVPADTDLVTRAADMIGQGLVEASPLAMALVAATADSGAARTPTLLPDVLPGSRLGQIDPGVIRQLQEMMRLTVTSGTASALDLPGIPIYAKTGTAEFQAGKATGTNAWLVGYRGDLAFAVLVENGESGGQDAAPIVADFLNRIPNRLYR